MCLYNYVLNVLVILGHLILVLMIWMVHVTFIGTALTTSKNTSKLVRNLLSSNFQAYKYARYELRRCVRAHMRYAVARVRVRAKSILEGVRNVRACGPFWACDVR